GTRPVEVDGGDSNRPRDAPSVNLTARVLSAPDFAPMAGPTRVSLTRLATGTYVASYAVPSNIDHASLIDLWADVTVGSNGYGLGATVYVPVPNALLVWYRTVSSGPSNATLIVYVASTAGLPLGNAGVSIRTSSFLGGYAALNGTTDASGSTRFELPLNASVSHDFVGN